MHASGDGFESYKNQQFPALVTNDCDTLKKRFNAIAPREFLYAMLNRTAIATLKTLSGSVSYQKVLPTFLSLSDVVFQGPL